MVGLSMKTNPFVSSQARKVRKAYFNANKQSKHVALSAPLDKELQRQYGVKRLPIRREDEVKVVRGKFESRTGHVTAVKLRALRILIESCENKKVNGETSKVPVHPSNVVITKLKIDKGSKSLIEKIRKSREAILEKLGHAK
jgi:large subunit ribosomal protein L26e